MKKYFSDILNIILMIIGVSFLLFVLKMIWFPPSSMGLIMDSAMMYHHMGTWLKGTTILFLLFFSIGALIWFIIDKILNKFRKK
ncbi:hypothetical protein [Tepidibacillus sp. HK-1]|uniref:hypothetical protein n=1 Tax=Tepidibacillus sp. HK-1 TaxID=1883407 RepID=UPI000852946F|nr:hypothetical protein [Tepidibacillus sp. HK-1]GBF10925.1 hypothetical protein HK1_00941 [Tepidibacillus sp. HK-1]